MSTIVVEARALSSEAVDDIDAAKTMASTRPMTPTGSDASTNDRKM